MAMNTVTVVARTASRPRRHQQPAPTATPAARRMRGRLTTPASKAHPIAPAAILDSLGRLPVIAATEAHDTGPGLLPRGAIRRGRGLRRRPARPPGHPATTVVAAKATADVPIAAHTTCWGVQVR